MQNEEYKIVFKGKGLEELKDLARAYDVPEDDLGKVVIKAMRLLKITKEKKSVSFKDGGQEFTLDTKRL